MSGPDTSLYTQLVTQGGLAGPPVKALASSAVVLWRRRADTELEVFWVRRDPRMQFMGGFHAFPGGGVARADAEVGATPAWLHGAPAGLSADRVSGAMPASLTEGLPPLPPDDVPGLVVATFRELFEEAGLLPLAPGSPVPSPEALAAARRALLAKEVKFPALVQQLGVTLDASRLTFAGRWLTPPFAPIRFDNRFFLLEHRPEDPLPGDSAEAVEEEWIRPADALARWHSGPVIAAPPILYLLGALADAGPRAALDRLREPTDANLGPYRKIEFRPGVLMFPLRTPTLPPATHTNTYLVGTGEAVLVDPGTPDPAELARLEAALTAARDHLGRRVTAIWLTHHHPDHVGGVAHLAARLGVPVAAHAATAERLAARGLRVDHLLADGERVVLAGHPALTLAVFHTPGHARGHLAFHDETFGSLLAGDLISAISTIVVDPPEGNMDDYLASLERCAALGAGVLFPGHGPALADAGHQLRELVRHRAWREERILAAWASGTRSAEALVPQVYDDVPPEVWPLAARQVVAHLNRLQRAGRLP